MLTSPSLPHTRANAGGGRLWLVISAFSPQIALESVEHWAVERALIALHWDRTVRPACESALDTPSSGPDTGRVLCPRDSAAGRTMHEDEIHHASVWARQVCLRVVLHLPGERPVVSTLARCSLLLG